MHFNIKGFGYYAPEKILTNQDLEKMVDTSDEWITSRTGIKERHIIGDDQACSDLALNASKQALEDASMVPDDITHIILATFTPDSFVPSASCILSHKLGIKHRVPMDVAAACSGFLYALETGRAILSLHPEAKVLVGASEVLTRRTNWEDRGTCVLFGDAAGAVVLTASDEPEDGPELIDVALSSDGGLGDLLTAKGGGSQYPYKLGEPVGEEYFVQMKGQEVFRHAVRSMTDIAGRILEKNGLTADDVDVLVPHQANLRIIFAVGKKLNIPEEKVFVNVHKFGNTSAASVPVAITEAKQSGFVKKGGLMLVVSFGGGFTWGASLIRF